MQAGCHVLVSLCVVKFVGGGMTELCSEPRVVVAQMSCIQDSMVPRETQEIGIGGSESSLLHCALLLICLYVV